MSDQRDGGDSFNQDVAAALPEFRRLIEKHSELMASLMDEGERRAAEVAHYKQMMRVAFLTNETATEEDFERLWPRLFDDHLLEHAHGVYMQTAEALLDQYEGEGDEGDE